MLEQLFYCTNKHNYDDKKKYDMINCTALFRDKNNDLRNKTYQNGQPDELTGNLDENLTV